MTTSLTEWLWVAASTVAAFVIAILFDMGFKYRLQLVYGAAVAGSAEPLFRTKPAVRHVVILLLTCLGVYIFRQGRLTHFSVSAILWLALLVIYGALLFSDSLRDLKERRSE